MSNENCILCMILKVDRENRNMKLCDPITNQECYYQGNAKEISRYEEIFDIALDNNVYPFVEYDTKERRIVAI